MLLSTVFWETNNRHFQFSPLSFGMYHISPIMSPTSIKCQEHVKNSCLNWYCLKIFALLWETPRMLPPTRLISWTFLLSRCFPLNDLQKIRRNYAVSQQCFFFTLYFSTVSIIHQVTLLRPGQKIQHRLPFHPSLIDVQHGFVLKNILVYVSLPGTPIVPPSCRAAVFKEFSHPVLLNNYWPSISSRITI